MRILENSKSQRPHYKGDKIAYRQIIQVSIERWPNGGNRFKNKKMTVELAHLFTLHLLMMNFHK